MRKTVLLLTITILAVLLVPVQAQDDSQTVTAEFIYHEANPVLQRGAEGEWDSGYAAIGHVVYADDLFHMLYVGSERGLNVGRPGAIGYAFSEDGVNWTKHPDNPVLELPDGMGPRVRGVAAFAVFVDGDTWTIYLTPRTTTSVLSAGQELWRASATAPTGPWTLDEEPLLVMEDRHWDDPFVPNSVVQTEAGFVLYYTGCRAYILDVGPCAVGRATAPDGMVWTRYDDPATTDPGSEYSDPVFVAGLEWDEWVYSPSVLFNDGHWELFFEGGAGNTAVAIGYATSEDGIHWTRLGGAQDGRILTEYGDGYRPAGPSVVVVDDTYYVYFSISAIDDFNFEIGLATGTIKHD